jgi:hypothetical protein
MLALHILVLGLVVFLLVETVLSASWGERVMIKHKQKSCCHNIAMYSAVIYVFLFGGICVYYFVLLGYCIVGSRN